MHSGRYIISASGAPKAGSDADPEYLLTLQEDCARSDIQRFLGYSERSSGQLREKVLSLGYPPFVADHTVDWAVEFDLVDDKRFCALYISSRVMGKIRLKNELSRKKVPEEVIQQVIAEVSERDSREELVRQVSNRYGRIEDRETARRRASGWLSRRGFSSDIVYSVLKEAL
ncbi:MAG: regulatory protein RecX [Candidatus Sabulitectum sp.]|nr:regulatory protein RecX [Candidatus Sabulitectum sp.]